MHDSKEGHCVYVYACACWLVWNLQWTSLFCLPARLQDIGAMWNKWNVTTVQSVQQLGKLACSFAQCLWMFAGGVWICKHPASRSISRTNYTGLKRKPVARALRVPVLSSEDLGDTNLTRIYALLHHCMTIAWICARARATVCVAN